MISRHQKTPSNSAFTLIELLVVLALLGFVSAMLTVAMSGATRQARIRRCEGELLNYGYLLQTIGGGIPFTNLRTLEFPANPRVGAPPYAVPGGLAPANGTNLSVVESNDLSRAKMLLRRDYYRMVLPQCMADLLIPPAGIQRRVRRGSTMGTKLVKVSPPTQWDLMRQLVGLPTSSQIDAVAATTIGSTAISNLRVDPLNTFYTNATFRSICMAPAAGSWASTWTRQFESSECLYLIFATQVRNGISIADSLQQKNIGDTDGDGVPEILDPWGTPVSFIRQPVGLQNATLQNYDSSQGLVWTVPTYEDPTTSPVSQAALAFPSTTPEAMDLLGADLRYLVASSTDFSSTNYVIDSGNFPVEAYFPYQVPPIVISAGPDQGFGIYLPENLPGAALNTPLSAYEAASGLPLPAIDSSFVLSAAPTPLFANVLGTGSLPYRYPDPFFDLAAITSSSTITSTPGTTAFGAITNARRGGGLGGFVGVDARPANLGQVNDSIALADDNVTSIAGGL